MKPEEIVSGRFYELSGSVTVGREDIVFYRVPVQAVREGVHLILKMADTDEDAQVFRWNSVASHKGEVGWIFEDLSYDECGGYIVDDPTGDAFMLEEVNDGASISKPTRI